MAGTRGTTWLGEAGIAHHLHEYRYSGEGPAAAEAARELGIDPARMFKSLVADADGELVFALVPATGELSLKRLAAAAGAKAGRMAAPRDAERATGYRIGGISPLGSRRPLPVYVDASARDFDRICLNAGGRGQIAEVSTGELLSLLGAHVAPLTAG
jgi:Cys-tRNA(Pro)/Cys-tRNA(Cys) deacylase